MPPQLSGEGGAYQSRLADDAYLVKRAGGRQPQCYDEGQSPHGHSRGSARSLGGYPVEEQIQGEEQEVEAPAEGGACSGALIGRESGGGAAGLREQQQ